MSWLVRSGVVVGSRERLLRRLRVAHLTVSLAQGGAGLGMAWGEQLALELLAGAGFEVVGVHEKPRDPGNAIFVSRRRNP